jgi:hypothetical protein
VPVSPEGVTSESADVAVAADGTTIVVWRTIGGAAQASIRPPGGGFTAPQTLGSALTGPKVAADAAGNAIAVWETPAGGVQSAFRGAGAGFGAATTLDATGTEPAVAVNPGGTSVIAWDDGATIHTRVQIPGQPVDDEDHASTNPDRPNVAVGAGNVVVVVWRENGSTVRTRVRFTNGQWQPSTNFATVADTFPDAAVDQTGNATAVWRSNTNFTQAALRSPGSAQFGGSSSLGGALAGARPNVDSNPAGLTAAIWSDGSPSSIRLATRSGNGPFAVNPQPLSAPAPTPGAIFPRVEVTNSGAVLGVWSRFNGNRFVVQGASAGGVQDLSNAFVDSEFPRLDSDNLGNAAAAWEDSTGRIQVSAFDGGAPSLGLVSVPPSSQRGAAVPMSVSPFDTWSPVSVSWSFGDGQTASGTSVSHAYGAPGIFNVTVTATDAAGNGSTVTTPILVVQPPPPPPPPEIDSPVRVTWGVNKKRIYLLRLKVLDLPKGGKAELRCKGKRCPYKRKSSKKRRKGDITLFKEIKPRKVVGKKQRTFRAGQTLQLRITAPGHIGKVAKYRLRKGRIPSAQPLCLPPGAKKPRKSC